MNLERWRSPGARAVSTWERASRGATYNPLSRSVIQNPYETYARLRRRSPVHRSAILGSWLLTRHEDVPRRGKGSRAFLQRPEVAESNPERAPAGPG